LKILITGSGGLLGRFASAVAAARHEVLALSRADLDVTDRAAVDHAVGRFLPRAVLHCAAYTDVDGAERHSGLAMEVNAVGAEWVAKASRRVGAAMVLVSTDYVFDGERRTPYEETAPTCPRSSYGRSKLEGERRVAEACPDGWLTVRTGWVYGPSKGFVDWAKKRLVASEELPLVEDQTGSPTYALELAEALLALVEGEHRGLFHFVNRGETTWVTLGRFLASELGVTEPRVKTISSEALGRPAPRPVYSAMSVEKFEDATGIRVRTWQDALKRYLADSR